MEAEISYAFYLDNSGSVSGSTNYWTTVSEVLARYPINRFYFWNSTVVPADKKALQESIETRRGTGGTSPNNVATSIVQHQERNIILMTDGEVDDNSVRLCDEIFEKNAEKFKISKIICFIVSNGGDSVNMSVTCPFTRYCDHQVFKKERDTALETVVQHKPEDFKILESLDSISLQNLEDKYSTIEGLIIALNMGKSGNIPLKNQLVQLKNRLVKELSFKMTGELGLGDKMRLCLEKNDLVGALEIATKMTQGYLEESLTTDIEKKMSHLINLCGDLRGKYNLNEIKSNKMDTAATAEKGELVTTLEVQDLSQNPIECPIIMDQDVPQIMIDECDPLLLGVQKAIVDDVSACPLRLLNYPELKAKLKSRLSNFIGVKFGDKMYKNPFTQRRLLGAIPLGSHQSHVKVGNYTLAKLLTGGKILGNLNMYYAVIWHIINEDEIQYLIDIKKNVTEHLLFRLRNTTTMASLCGQAQFVNNQIPTDVAVWYCVNSGFFNQPTDRDTFRFHLYNLKPMVQILRVLGYPIHEGFEKHYRRTLATLNLLSKIKRLKTNEKKAFKNLFLGLYQNGIFVDTTKVSEKFKETEVCTEFVPVDGPASPEQVIQIRQMLPKCVQELSNDEIYHISTLIDASKSAADIFLSYDLLVPELPNFKMNWAYGMDKFGDSAKINPMTLRPYYKVQGKVWKEVAQIVFKVEDTSKLFKGMKYIEGYILKYLKKPTYEEIVLFYYNRYVEAGKVSTLPFLTHQWTVDLLGAYEVVFPEGYVMENIVKRLNETRPINKRIEIQQ